MLETGIDSGHSFDDVARIWAMEGRYYTENLSGLDLVVLDGNEIPKKSQNLSSFPYWRQTNLSINPQ